MGQYHGGQRMSNEENDVRKQKREIEKTKIILAVQAVR